MSGLAEPGKLPAVFQWLTPRFHSRRFEMINFVLLFMAIGLCSAHLAATSDEGDQDLLLQQNVGQASVWVFGPRGDIPTGEATFGVITLDSNTPEVQFNSRGGFSLQENTGRDNPAAHADTSGM